MDNQRCPLCYAQDSQPFYKSKWRVFLKCPLCSLIYVPSTFFLSPEDEKARYDLHQNSPADLNYRKFLNHIFIPVNKYLSSKRNGLDFGSGPAPTLSVMFEESGHNMEVYDYYYAPNLHVFGKKYDFITATEVLEHLYDSKKELDRLWSCLEPGGILGIMTKRALDLQSFSNWHYKNDPTHVCFFSKETFKWLSIKWGSGLIFTGKDSVIFKKAG